MKRLLCCFAFALLLSVTGNVSMAQLNNKPFSFHTPGGGVGMSAGGKQVILNKEILGTAPANLVRDPAGNLLSVAKERGGSAIVSFEGGSFIPSFRGGSYRGDNASWSAGVFNTFFEPRAIRGDGGGTGALAMTYAHMQTGGAISTWTGRVATDAPVSYLPANSVDLWTGMVVQASY